MRASLPVAAALTLAWTPLASAQLAIWNKLGEDKLHSTYYYATDWTEDEIVAPCDAGGRLRLPPAYAGDYKLSSRDQSAMERMMFAAKRYAKIADALKEGYLPLKDGFERGLGLQMIHPELLRDGTFRVDKPDILSYIKTRGQPEFRLVGLAFAAGESKPGALPGMDFSAKSRLPTAEEKAGTGTWDYEDELCFLEKPGSWIALLERDKTPYRCRGGKLLTRLWVLRAWPFVYNPHGLFAYENPMVDFLDRGQEFGPLCSPPKKQASKKLKTR